MRISRIGRTVLLTGLCILMLYVQLGCAALPDDCKVRLKKSPLKCEWILEGRL